MGDRSYTEGREESNSLDGEDLARVLTSMAAIKPLLEKRDLYSPPSFPIPSPHCTSDLSNLSDTSTSASTGDCGEEPPRKRQRLKDKKSCSVCGDRALGYNFNAVTCESCKAFFRRNAHKHIPSCLFQGNCLVDTRTRRFCPACRIKKCFAIGMKAEMILDDTEKKARKEKVVENRSKKQTDCETPIHPVNLSNLVVTLDSSASVPNITSNKCELNEHLGRQYGLPKALRGHMFKHPPRELLPSDPQFYRRLSEEEKWLLNDISTAFQATIATLQCQEDTEPQKSNPSLNELINSTDESVRQLIRFVGKVTDFQRMRRDDQILCLKNSVMQSVLLRSACIYILEKDVFLCARGELTSMVLQNCLNNNALYTAHINFCRSIKSIILNNYTLWALAQILALFNPCGAAIVEREMLSSLQDRYILLLKHYLESEFSFSFSQDYFLAIQDMLGDLKSLGEAYTTVIYNANPTEIEPLLLEVFNLK